MALRVIEKDNSALRGQIFDCEEDFFLKYQMVKEKRLGRGLSGEVILASFHDEPDNKRAVKVFTTTNENAMLFVTETAILQKCSHPNIVGNIQAFKCPDSYILCMPYYPRGNLKQNLTQLTTDRVIKYFLQLTSAVLYLHAHDIVHRDVKPDNILLSDDDDVILIDFGLACPVTSRMARATTAGTKGYMPPEVLTGQNVDMFKSDLYAVGVVLWNMVFRQHKAGSKDYSYYVNKSKQLSPVCRTLLSNLLHHDPKTRWNDQQLANAVSTLPDLTKMASKLWGPKS